MSEGEFIQITYYGALSYLPDLKVGRSFSGPTVGPNVRQIPEPGMVCLFREVCARLESLRQKGLRISAAHPSESFSGNGANSITSKSSVLIERILTARCDMPDHHNTRPQWEAKEPHTGNHHRDSLCCPKRGFFCLKQSIHCLLL